MIRVVRPAEPPEVAAALAKPYPNHGNKTELDRAREYYATVPPPTKAYKFERYNQFAVCHALDDLFHEKCAYCESSYRAVDSSDVEHFRPKGAVKEAPAHSGYWWLAASWTNLLPSCPPCNQLRRQLAYDPTMTLDEFEALRQKQAETTSGKANAFPVKNGKWVLDEGGDLADEDPLLINPCDRDPLDHLEFVFDWARPAYIWDSDQVAAVIRPKPTGGGDDPYAKASIAIYGLRRAGLFRAQMERVRDLQRLCHPIVDTLRDLATTPPPANEPVLLQRLTRYRQNLLDCTRPDQPYAAMASAFVAVFESELARLKQEGV